MQSLSIIISKFFQPVKVLVTQLCPALWDPMKLYLPGSSTHRNLQARLLEWVSIPFSRGSSWPRDWTRVSCIGSRFFTIWATTQMIQLSGPTVQFQINCSIPNQLAYFYISVSEAACFLVSKCLLVSLDYSNQWPQLSGLKQLKWSLAQAPEVNPTLPLSLWCLEWFFGVGLHDPAPQYLHTIFTKISSLYVYDLSPSYKDIEGLP